ncbi:MAG: rhodanese-like domain-containing protein, partial [Ktedonobacteraceae bacterium]
LFDSIFNRLLKLDDGVEVYPAHVAGSLCGRGMSSKTSSTIGFERKHNTAATPRSRIEFIHDMNENLPQRPPNMYNIVERNRGDFAHMEAPLYPRPLDAFTFQRELENGAIVIDTRSPHAFGERHIPGAIHVYLRGSSFATRVGFVVSPENRLLLVLKNERDLSSAIDQLFVVAFDQVIGYLDGGISTWQEADLTTQQLGQISVEALHSMRHDLKILDVRDQSEWEEGHIKGAIHIPYYFIVQRLQELHNTQPLAVMCASGQRSSIACSLLQKHGFTQLFNVVGGMEAWNEEGFDMEA